MQRWVKFVTFEPQPSSRSHHFSPKSSFHWPLGFMMVRELTFLRESKGREGKDAVTLLFHFSRESLFLFSARHPLGSLCLWISSFAYDINNSSSNLYLLGLWDILVDLWLCSEKKSKLAWSCGLQHPVSRKKANYFILLQLWDFLKF